MPLRGSVQQAVQHHQVPAKYVPHLFARPRGSMPALTTPHEGTTPRPVASEMN